MLAAGALQGSDTITAGAGLDTRSVMRSKALATASGHSGAAALALPECPPARQSCTAANTHSSRSGHVPAGIRQNAFEVERWIASAQAPRANVM